MAARLRNGATRYLEGSYRSSVEDRDGLCREHRRAFRLTPAFSAYVSICPCIATLDQGQNFAPASMQSLRPVGLIR